MAIDTRTSALEIMVAKMYVFLLPFRMFSPFEFLQDYFHGLVDYFDSIVILLGLALWILNAGNLSVPKTDKPLYRTIKYSIWYLNISSLVMAVITYLTYGNYNGVSPFYGILPMELYYFQYLMMFLYNIRVFRILKYSTLINLISLTCDVLLVIGYIQILVILGIGTSIYDSFAEIIGGFVTTEDFAKLPLTTSEGSYAGMITGIFVFPFLYSRYLYGEKKAIYKVMCWILPLFYMSSSTAYFLFLIDTFIFLYFYYKKNRKKAIKLIHSTVMIVLLTVAAISISSNIGYQGGKVSYLIAEKAMDKDNGSMASRSVPFYINWGSFTESPITGVGNGLQGYYYHKYFPKELLLVPGTDLGEFYRRVNEYGVLSNGSTFLLGYFSGYGIFGLIVLVHLIAVIMRTRQKHAGHMGMFNQMFIMGASSFLFAAIFGEMYCLFYAWFVISMPLMYFRKREEKTVAAVCESVKPADYNNEYEKETLRHGLPDQSAGILQNQTME